MTDHCIVAYAYRPLLEPVDVLFKTSEQFLYLEVPSSATTEATRLPVPADADAGHNSSSPVSGLHLNRRRSSMKLSSSPAQSLLQEQIFLGLTAFAHEPKEDVPDVIEDLGLAGIRFVYFSPSNERQTKAFGQRLGLDTDWNSCSTFQGWNELLVLLRFVLFSSFFLMLSFFI
jgi:hypothetical protein